MLMMENAEEVQQALERFTKLKQTQIPRELEDYLCFVAKSGDTIFRWAVIKALFREKLIAVIKQFHEQTAIDDLPHYPNVDPFNYETMKTALLERLDSFSAAPFTVQRICELLTDPRKQYSRIDKFMRAIEKNILVVSTTEPGRAKSLADSSDYSDSLDSMVNGSSNVTGGALGDDLAGDIDVDIELENGAATISGTAVVEQATTAALPSINTLNSAILAANGGGAAVVAAVVATTADLLSEHDVHHTDDDHQDPLHHEDANDDDDEDDEDVVHNHLTTDPTESLPDIKSVTVVVVSDEVTCQLPPAKKRGDEEGDEEEESAKRVKLTEKEGEEEEKKQDTIPEKEDAETSKPSVEDVAATGDGKDVIEAAETCETEAKDLKDEVQAKEVDEKKEEVKSADPVAVALAPISEQLVAAAVEKDTVESPTIEELAVVESEKKAEDIPSASTEAIIAVPVVVAEAALPEKESLSPEAMEAETATCEPTAIAASEMEVDSAEAAALVSEESVSMDEPMEDQ